MTTATLNYRHIKSLILPRINWKIVYLSGILFTLFLLVFYIFLINELTAGVYLIKNYNKEISNLSGENRTLETNFAEGVFRGEIQGKAAGLGFEKTAGVKYMKIIEDSLARAK